MSNNIVVGKLKSTIKKCPICGHKKQLRIICNNDQNILFITCPTCNIKSNSVKTNFNYSGHEVKLMFLSNNDMAIKLCNFWNKKVISTIISQSIFNKLRRYYNNV